MSSGPLLAPAGAAAGASGVPRRVTRDAAAALINHSVLVRVLMSLKLCARRY